MTRLTKEIRENIARTLLLRRFKDEGEALAKTSADLFTLVYEDKYDQETRNLMAKLHKKQPNCFITGSTIGTNCNGYYVEIGSQKIGAYDIKWITECSPKPFLNNLSPSKRYSYQGCNIGLQILDFVEKQTKFADAIQAAKVELMGALASISTAKQLAEMWPEAIPIIGHHIPTATGSTNLPAVKFANLNAAFGLQAVQP